MSFKPQSNITLWKGYLKYRLKAQQTNSWVKVANKPLSAAQDMADVDSFNFNIIFDV
jgi:hypothetical protein